MGCQEGKAYRAVLLEGDSCFSVLALLLAFTTQPRKKSNHKGDESTYDIVRRMSSPRAWDVAFVPFPEDFAPLPSQAENWLGMPCQLEFSPSFFLHGYGRYVCREAQVTESNSDGGYVG